MQSSFKPQVFVFLFMVISLFGERALAQYTSVPFLLISPSARITAMGESGVALADDASSASINPAGLGFQKGQEVNLTYTGWIPQYRSPRILWSDRLIYGNGNYRISIPEIGGSIATSFTYLYIGTIENINTDNNYSIQFSSYEYAFSASYGTEVTQDLGVGLGFHYIHSKLVPSFTEEEIGSATASAISGDIGILYQPSHVIIPFTQIDFGKRLGIGLALTNMGPSIYYIDKEQADPLPTNLRLGIALDFIKSERHRITWTYDANKLIISRTQYKADPFFTAITKTWTTTLSGGRKKNISDIIREVNFGTGIEYWYANMIALRGGYFYEDQHFGNRQMFTFGAGVRYNIFRLDLSYIALYGKETARTPANETLRLTMSLNWNNEKSIDDAH